MPHKKTDTELLAEIRQVVFDQDRGFKIRNYNDGSRDLDKLDYNLAFEVIRDIVKGQEDTVTRDYRMTKRMAARATKKQATPAP